VPDHYLTRAVDLQESDPHSMLSFSRRLLAWRRTQPALCRGLPDFLEAPEPLLALRREAEGHVCVAVFNLGPESATLSLPCGLEPLVDLGLPPARMEGRTLHLAPWAAFYGQPT
jgi:alpha-glucosidase